MTTTLQSWVCGRWHTGTGTPTPLYNPATEEVLAECNADGIDWGEVLDYGRSHGVHGLQALTFAERAERLTALSAAIHEHRDELIGLSTSNGGNTRGDAKFDIDGATGTLAAYGAFGAKLGAKNHISDGDGVQLGRTPKFWGQHVLVPRQGVAVHVNAFNFPAWGIGEKMACAILAGAPVLEKAGTPSALLAWRLAQIVVDSGLLPDGAFQFVAGGVGDLLDRLGPQDALAFTGSSGTGAKLRGTPNLVRHNVRVNVEADSLNAAILAPDADADSDSYAKFVGNVVVDMTQKAGQKCTAVRRILVPRDRVEDVVADLVDRLDGIKVGDPADDSVRMGPVASKRQHDDVRAGIETLIAAGAKPACGGLDLPFETGYFVAPTLLVAEIADLDAAHADEVFGPVATVLPYDGSPAEAVRLANRGGGSLVASCYSSDRKWLEPVVLGIAPWHGRVWTCSDKGADQTWPPGAVMPQMVHGGPGRAGGGEELGGLRGLSFYLQRTAVQGFQGIVARAFGPDRDESAES